MAVIWKDVLYPGTVVVPDNDGKPVRCMIQPHDIQNACQVGNAKIKRHWGIPGCWGHQPGALPVQLAEDRIADQVKNTFGHAIGFEVVGGILRVGLDVPDADDVKRLAKIRFVSPRLDYDWRDGTGKLWKGLTVTHIAATPRPVWPKQKPFNIALGHDRPRTLFLSLDAYESNPMSGENDDKKTGETETEKKAPPAETETKKDDAGGSADFRLLVDALRTINGLTIPDGVSTLSDLTIAVKASAGTQAEQEDEDDEDEDDSELDDEDDETQTGDADEDDLKNPNKTGEVPPPIQMAFDRASKLDRQTIEKRITKLEKSGRVTPAIRDGLLRDLKKVQLGYDDAGNLKTNKVLDLVEGYEKLPAKSASLTGKKGKKKDAVELGNDRVGEAGASEYDDTFDSDAAFNDAWDSALGRKKK